MIVRPVAGCARDLARWAANESPFAVALLDGDGSERGRLSYLGLDPVETRVSRSDEPDPWHLFDRLELTSQRGYATGACEEARLPRWIGAIAYDLAWAKPSVLGLREGPRFSRERCDVAFFHRFDALLVGDHRTDSVLAVAEDEGALSRLLERLDVLRRGPPASIELGPLEHDPPADHVRAIRDALLSIADGDIYQVNLARRFRASYRGRSPARALARRMQAASPVPFGALLELPSCAGLPGRSLVARTMERFLRWDRRDGRIETRPIKGTIERVANGARKNGDDEARARVLREDPKELAEHAMIIDLMRNDLGRIAEVGSVVVERAFEVEPYAHLHHLVSTIGARTRRDVGLRDVLEATFPPGSVTGTPKLRAIERIEALEAHPRRYYCGALGFVDRSGGLSLAVAIRTAQLVDGELEYFAGGGIVEASVVEREIAETNLKARALMDAFVASPGPDGQPRVEALGRGGAAS